MHRQSVQKILVQEILVQEISVNIFAAYCNTSMDCARINDVPKCYQTLLRIFVDPMHVQQHTLKS
jgi:hypothetical protein